MSGILQYEMYLIYILSTTLPNKSWPRMKRNKFTKLYSKNSPAWHQAWQVQLKYTHNYKKLVYNECFISIFHVCLLYKTTEVEPSVVKQADAYNFDTEQYVGV